jgi:hypothetical protein
MARFAKGRRALAISDRSGAAFPYNEMVKEWNGAFVHNPEFEIKQPQLEPHPVGADPQGLMNARPARVEFPVQDILPNNPFTTTAANAGVSVSYPANQINEGTTFVRFQSVKSPVGGVPVVTGAAGPALELTTTLDTAATATDGTITVQTGSHFPTTGFIMIEKILTANDTTDPLKVGTYQNEVIQYTGKAGDSFTGCTRGTSAPFRGLTPPATTAGTHPIGANVFGCYAATAVATTVEVGPTLPDGTQATEQQFNSITFSLISNATSTETGGGFQCTIGPLNDRS